MMASNELDGATSVNATPGVLQRQNKICNTPCRCCAGRSGRCARRTRAWTRTKATSMAGVAKGIGTMAMWNLPLGLALRLHDGPVQRENYPQEVEPAAATGIPCRRADRGTGRGARHRQAVNTQNLRDHLLEHGRRTSGWARAHDVDLRGAARPGIRPAHVLAADQRVLVMSQLLNFGQAMKIADQHGDTTWASFGKPLVASLGGNGALQAVDLVNNALGLDGRKATLCAGSTPRAGCTPARRPASTPRREADPRPRPRPGSGCREMQLAAMANDRLGFLNAHRKALDAARKAVGEDPRVPDSRASVRRIAGCCPRGRVATRSTSSGSSRPTPRWPQCSKTWMNWPGRHPTALARYAQFSALITQQSSGRRSGK